MTPAIASYLADRIRRPYPVGCAVLTGSTSVASFGDIRTATIATLGINPSDSEFVANGSWLTGNRQRFETLDSLGLAAPEDADDAHIHQVLQTCHGYFTGPNPYWRWFRPLESLLNDSLEASYQDGSAAHLDLVQWATSPVWRQVPRTARDSLIRADREFLRTQLSHEGIRLVLMNGRRVMDEVTAMGVPLVHRAALIGGRPRDEVLSGDLDGTHFIGWNKTFPAGGISRAQRRQIIDVIAGWNTMNSTSPQQP